MSKGGTDLRRRVWWFVLYPESAPADWVEQLEERMIPCAISPLHDKDTDKEGNLKKPHYHVLMSFEGKKSYEQVAAITRSLNQPIPKAPESITAAYNYLAHFGFPDKFQYSLSDIRHLCGFSVKEVKTDMSINSVLAILRDNGIAEFSDAVDFISDSDCYAKLLPVLVSNAFFFQSYLTSRRFVLSQASAPAPAPDDSQ